MLKRSVNPEFSVKKALVCIALFCTITGYIYGDYAVDSTRSMSSTHLGTIRTACSGGSDVATYYWNEFIENDPTKTDSSFYEEEKGWLDYFNSDIYVKYAMWGAVGLDMPVTTPPTTDTTLLNKAKFYLLDPTHQYVEHYLDLDAVWDSLATGNDSGTNSWYRFTTGNVALMVDMLWDYVDSTDSVAMCTKLDSLADTLYYHIDRLKETWGMGEKPQFFSLMGEAATLGYVGLVLGNTAYVNYAKYIIFDYPIPYLEEPQYGYLDLLTTRAGYLALGYMYSGCELTKLTDFLSAYLRMTGENLYETEMIKDIVQNWQNMIAPDMQGIVLDDCFYVSNPEGSALSIDGLYQYYYNNTNCESDNWLRWYFNEYKDKYCTGNNYPTLEYHSRYYYPIFCYNPDKSPEINASYSMPSTITGVTHSDEELTTFRSEITDQEDFESSISMYVNYDNSLDPSFHEHSDQSSFQLFGLEKFMLIDTGYESAGFYTWAKNAIHWHHSPYAHNLIMVNPDSSVEATHLEHHYNGDTSDPLDNSESTYPLHNPLTGKYWEPRYRNKLNASNPQIMSCPNPSFREYFIHNDEIEKLRIYMDYEEDPIDDDTIRVTRNYYFLDDSYFVIVDDVENLNPGSSNSNVYWNQLHFKPYTSSNENVTINGNNIFTLDAGNDAYLYGTIGATSPFHNVIEEKLPWGGEQSHTRRHQRIKSVVEDKKTSYITLLMPSESATNPITAIIDGDSYYAIEVYDAAKSPTEKSYYAVSDSLLDISFTDIDINSDAGFVGLTYRPGYQYDTKITQFIMAEGDSLLYNDTTLVQCSNVDEIIAEYSGTELSVIVKSDDGYPHYKILRQGVDPEDFSSIAVEDGENGASNIGSIWYDSKYFYVNWFDFSSSPVYLTTSISVPEGDCLEIGNNVTINCMNDDVNIEVYGEISFGDSVTFTSPDSVRWDGLYFCNTNNSIEIDGLTFEHSTIENEADSLTISNSAFNNATLEQYGNKLYLSYTDFDTSNVYCYYTDPGSKVGDPDNVEINISYCSFENLMSDYPIYICNYDLYDINNNTISDCNQSIYLYESGHPVMCDIIGNVFEDNNSIGIKIYHSYANINENNVVRRNSYGIVAANNSSISIIGDASAPYQTVNDNSNEEIVTDQGSYPERFQLNKIYDDSYTQGTADQYLFRCNLGLYSERCLDAEYNYWGSASLNWGEWDGDSRFSPSDAFDYIPVWDPGQGSKDGNTEAHLLYVEADSLIKKGLYKDAKAIYRSIIDLYTSTDYALYSMKNLLPMEQITGQDFSSLRDYYLTDSKCNITEDRTKLSQYLANYCTIELGDYPTAISFFEDIIANPDTELDSVYAVIDAGYTYLLMENSGKFGYVGKMPELKPKSREDFFTTSDKLISELFGLLEEENNNEPETEYAFELRYNYPNPFRGSTKISFSLPASVQKADLKIYNIRGQLVRKLDIDNTPGIRSISWDGLDTYGKKVGSGIYFYRLTADKKETIKKMVIIR